MNLYLVAYVIGSGDLKIVEFWADDWWEAVEMVTREKVMDRTNRRQAKRWAKMHGWQFEVILMKSQPRQRYIP